ncbi:MAG: hypothetical protein A2095_04125 [Sphingomonadales bacterium GWF1_63_6]|nr:MAG: hypothetical protein A2095_04125 [Sphingomonadales bacterium GWF1_63_6]
MDIGSILNAPVIDFGPNPRAMVGHANNGKSRFDPRINRNTGQPHEHRREIARNLHRVVQS